MVGSLAKQCALSFRRLASHLQQASNHLVLTSTDNVIVQLVVDDGRLNALTILPAVGG